MTTKEIISPWKEIVSLIKENDIDKLSRYVDTLNSRDLIYALGRLEKSDQIKFFSLLNPKNAANIFEELPEAQTIGIIEEMNSSHVATIMNELQSAHQADLLFELDDDDAEAILTEMKPEVATNVRDLIKYDPDSAGGLMITEFISFKASSTVASVKKVLRKDAEKYKEYPVRYIYVTDKEGVYIGVIQMQDLLINDADVQLKDIVINDSQTVSVTQVLMRPSIYLTLSILTLSRLLTTTKN